MHFYSWKKGLKTGIYYLRSQAKTSAQKFSVDISKTTTINVLSSAKQVEEQPFVCNRDELVNTCNKKRKLKIIKII